MKRLICFIAGLFIVLTGKVLGQYTVQIRFSQVWRSSNEWEWRVDIFADIFDSENNLVPESVTDQFFYDWYQDECQGGGWSPHLSGTGNSYSGLDLAGLWDKAPQSPDCCGESCHFESYMIYVRVLIDGQWYESGEVRAPDNELNNILPRDTIVVDQKRSNNNTDGYIGRGYTQGIYNYPAPFTFYNRAGQSEIFKASQGLFTSPNEKYHQWEEESDVVNHRSFTITSPQRRLVARLGSAHNAAIQTELISANQVNLGYLEFKDPWLVIQGDPKYYDPPYGYRNLGMAGADLEPYQPLPLQLLTTNVFKGVFLDQLIEPGKPYYSVAAPDQPINGITYFLSDWSAENNSAEFEDAEAGITAVIFRQPNAVVTARMKGHLRTSIQNATAHNNGRRVVRDSGGTLHAVYVDGRQIWHTYSDDDGETWAPETRIDDLLFFDVYKHQYPSIAEIGGVLHVAWALVSYIDEEPADAQVKYRMKYINQGQWEPVVNVGPPVDQVITIPKPAIGLIDVLEG